MSPRSALRAGALLAALGLIVSAVGLVWTVRATMDWRESARIERWPRALATVVAADELDGDHQEVTLRYEDAQGRTHFLDARFPLGLGDEVLPGSATSVVYDPQSPERAQLPGYHGWHNVARPGGLTLLVTGVWLGPSVFLLGGARTGPRQAWDTASATESWASATPPAAPGADGPQKVGAVAAVLGLLGVVVWTIGVTEAPAAFPPSPPDPATDAEPVDLPAVLSAPPPSSGPLVTPETAQQVFEAAWRVRDDALVRHDAATIRALETGPAQDADLSRMARGSPPNRADPGPGDVRRSTTLVPRQTEWPVSFLAQAVTTTAGEPWLEVMVFVRTGPDVPWKIAFDTGMSGTERYTVGLLGPTLDDEGYNVVPATSWLAPHDVVPALARYWQSWVEEGEPPTGEPSFAPGPWTTDYGTRHARQQGRSALNGLVAHYDYGTVPAKAHEVWTFGVYEDQLLVCAPMRDETTFTGPAHQDDQRRKWGRDLPPGVYASITAEDVRLPCVLVPSQPGSLGVFGADRWVTASRGNLAE